MTRIIINADDLGKDEYINQKILHLINEKAVSSATILANGPAYYQVKQIVKQNPQISFGVHLNLDEFKSLTNSEVLIEYGIIDINRNFIKNAIFNVKYFSLDLKNAIKQELTEQIQRVKNDGIAISHIDSHHFIHSIKELFYIIKDLCLLFNINKIRLLPIPSLRTIKLKLSNINEGIKYQSGLIIPKKSDRENYLTKIIIYGLDYLKRIIWCSYVRKYFRTTNKFSSYQAFFQNFYPKKLENKDMTIELMCHPGHYLYSYESELVEQRALNSKLDYKLISYNEL